MVPLTRLANFVYTGRDIVYTVRLALRFVHQYYPSLNVLMVLFFVTRLAKPSVRFTQLIRKCARRFDALIGWTIAYCFDPKNVWRKYYKIARHLTQSKWVDCVNV